VIRGELCFWHRVLSSGHLGCYHNLRSSSKISAPYDRESQGHFPSSGHFLATIQRKANRSETNAKLIALKKHELDESPRA
jgi:hypothetical protein